MDQTDDRTKSIDRNTGMCSKLHRKLREKKQRNLPQEQVIVVQNLHERGSPEQATQNER